MFKETCLRGFADLNVNEMDDVHILPSNVWGTSQKPSGVEEYTLK